MHITCWGWLVEQNVRYNNLWGWDAKPFIPICDQTLAEAKLGWEPKVRLNDRLKETIDYFKSYLEEGYIN